MCLLVFPLAVESPSGERMLVHPAHPMGRYLRTQEYWQRILEGSGGRLGPPRAVLSPRELEVLGRMGRGEDLKQIARELFVSYATVRNHVQHILAKLRVHSMQEAVGLHLLLDSEARGELRWRRLRSGCSSRPTASRPGARGPRGSPTPRPAPGWGEDGERRDATLTASG